MSHDKHSWITLAAIGLAVASLSAATYRLSEDFWAWWAGLGPWGAVVPIEAQWDRLATALFRVVRAGGTAGNLLAALAAFAALRNSRGLRTDLRYALWLGGVWNGFAATLYPLLSIALLRGDWSWFMKGLEPQIFWRIMATLLFGLGAIIVVRNAAAKLELFLDRSGARAGLLRWTLGSPLVGAAALVLAARIFDWDCERNPLLSPAVPGAALLMFYLISSRARSPRANTPHRADVVEFRPAWVAAAAAAVALLALIPGVR